MTKHMIELLKEERDLLNEIEELQKKAITEKQKQEENESSLWLNTPFKERGLTNEKQRKAYVTQQMNLLYPSFYDSYMNQIAQKQSKITWIREVIKVMMFLDIKEIYFEEKNGENSDKGNGA